MLLGKGLETVLGLLQDGGQDFYGQALLRRYQSLYDIWVLGTSDDSEPSWLEPELELKDFQLGSARLKTFFP